MVFFTIEFIQTTVGYLESKSGSKNALSVSGFTCQAMWNYVKICWAEHRLKFCFSQLPHCLKMVCRQKQNYQEISFLTFRFPVGNLQKPAKIS